MESALLQAVERVFCAIQEDWIAVTILWANQGHCQVLVRIRWVFAGVSNKETGSIEDSCFQIFIFLNESVLQMS